MRAELFETDNPVNLAEWLTISEFVDRHQPTAWRWLQEEGIRYEGIWFLCCDLKEYDIKQ